MRIVLILATVTALFSCRSAPPSAETKSALVCPPTQMPNADQTECITPQFPTRARQKSLQKSR